MTSQTITFIIVIDGEKKNIAYSCSDAQTDIEPSHCCFGSIVRFNSFHFHPPLSLSHPISIAFFYSFSNILFSFFLFSLISQCGPLQSTSRPNRSILHPKSSTALIVRSMDRYPTQKSAGPKIIDRSSVEE